MSTQGLRYENFTAKSLAIFGDRELYDNILKDIGGKWNPRMKPQPGWYIDKSQEDKLKKLISGLGIEIEPTKVVEVAPVKEKRKYTQKVKDLPEIVAVVEPEPIKKVIVEPIVKKEPKKKVVEPVAIEEKPVEIVEPIVVKKEPKKKVVEPIVVKKESEDEIVNTKSLDVESEDNNVESTEEDVGSSDEDESLQESEEDADSSDEDESLQESEEDVQSTEDEPKEKEQESENVSNTAESPQDDESKSENDQDVSLNFNKIEEDPRKKQQVKNPSETISKKSKEKFIKNYIISDDDVDENESRDMLEKYQKLYMYFKTYAQKPEKFDENEVKKLNKQTI